MNMPTTAMALPSGVHGIVIALPCSLCHGTHCSNPQQLHADAKHCHMPMPSTAMASPRGVHGVAMELPWAATVSTCITMVMPQQPAHGDATALPWLFHDSAWQCHRIPQRFDGNGKHAMALPSCCHARRSWCRRGLPCHCHDDITVAHGNAMEM